MFPHALLLSLLVTSALGSNLKLNVPRVLLPLTEEGAYFKLYSKGGCFTWKSTRPEIISVTPIPDPSADGVCIDPTSISTPSSVPNGPPVQCSSSALVSISGNLYSSISKTQAVIMAEDFHSAGRILRADVIVDYIQSLQIVTKTHELYLEEAPEEFAVRGYDDQGNEFSSLDGIVFKWKISDRQSKNIRFIKFRDSSYALDRVLEDIEARGLQGSKVLLEGIRTGSAKVSVSLASKASYSTSVAPAEVSVLVVANLFLVPSVAYVMPGGVVNYHAEQIKSNKLHMVDLAASAQYYLEVEDASLVTVNEEEASVFAGADFGSTKLFLRDRNVGNRSDLAEAEHRYPSAELHIVEADHMTLEIDPFRSWVVLVGNRYSLYVEIFDADNRKIFASSNLVVKIEFLEDGYFEVGETMLNGTWLAGKPLKSGSVEVKATLIGSKASNGEIIKLPTPLLATATLEVHAQINLDPPISIYPWDPTTQTSHQIRYVVNGGAASSAFVWSSSNTTISTVTQNGIAKTGGQVIGDAIVTAAMNRATQNYGTALVRVAPVIALDIVDDYEKEAEVGKMLSVPISLLIDDKTPVSDCVGLPLQFAAKDTKTFAVIGSPETATPETNSCATINLVANDVGFTTVHASYSYSSYDDVSKQIVISDEATVAAYKPLLPVHPATASALLSVGSSYQIVWTGGPQPWIKDPRKHFYKLETNPEDDPSVVKISDRIPESSMGHVYVFQVTCLQIGQVQLMLTVGNEKSASLPRPVLSSSAVTIRCGEPDRIELTADVEHPKDVGGCPLLGRASGRVAALCNENLPILVSVFDSAGQKFDNISTFNIDWSLNLADLATIASNGVIYPESGKNPFQILEPKGKSGSLEVTATLKTSGLILLGKFTSISDTILVNLVNDAVVSPEKMLLFNHPNNIQHLSIHHGSGFFDVTSIDGIVRHKYHSNNKTIALAPTAVGEVTVTVKDLCLVSKHPSPTARIQVSGVHSVELLVVDKVQLGKSVVAQVRLLDHDGVELPLEHLKFVNIDILATSKDVVKLDRKQDSMPEEVFFLVKGSQLGLTMLTAQVTYGDKIIKSPPAPIQVFPPLSLEPCNITLIIGAKFQVQVIGGPQPQHDSTVEFIMGNTKVATPNSAGLITALALGSTRLTGRVYGMDRLTGKRVVFSEDFVHVHVVKLDGVRIRAPVMLVNAGTEMPLQALGTDDHQNAFSFGSARPKLRFSWSVSDQEVADVVSVFHLNGIQSTDDGVVRFRAKNSGRVVVKLHVAITASLEVANQFQLDRDRELDAEIEIQVLEPLTLLSPVVDKNVVLMSPGSEFQLKTSRDYASGVKISYKMFNSSNIASVDDNGLIVAGDTTGTCVVQVSAYDGDFGGVVNHLSVLVHVKPVKFMMINVLQAFKASKPIAFLPKGVAVDLSVSFHDNLANRFDAVKDAGAVQYRPSRFESNHLSHMNTSAEVELTKVTETVLRTSAIDASMHDFIIFDVRMGFTPNVKKMAVADVIMLKDVVSGDRLETSSADWSSEPEGVVSLETFGNFGYGVALRSGHARISRTILGDKRITTDLEIEAVSKITFNRKIHGSDAVVTTASQRPQMIYFSVATAQSTDGAAKNFHAPREWTGNTPGVKSFLPTDIFQCRASFLTPRHDVSKIFRVESGFDLIRVSYACRLVPITNETSFFSSQIEVFVRPGQTLLTLNSNIEGDSITMNFFSPIKVITTDVKLSNVAKRGEVIVLGLPPVLSSMTCQASNPDLFHVGRFSFEQTDDEVEASSESIQRLVIPLTVKSAFWKSDAANSKFYVDVCSNKTGQTARIPIRVVVDEKCADVFEPGWLSLLTLVVGNLKNFVFLAICFFLAWLYVVKTTPVIKASEQPRPSAGDARSPFLNGSSPLATTARSPGSHSDQALNAENRPYLWTADSSPIYGSPSGQQVSSFSWRKSPRPLAQYSYTE